MDGLLPRFCTPPLVDETESDRKALDGAREGEVAFECRTLTTYTWGGGSGGPATLLAHGWASRASHMAIIARGLARQGHRVVAFDQPAHGRSRDKGGTTTNGFEFGRAIAAVGRACGPFDAVVGHSLGAASATNVISG